MTGKRLHLSQRDWLWTFQPSHWKSKKSDWLDLNQAVVRETTRFGEKNFHVRNLGDFRKMRREKRFDSAQKKLNEMREDRNNVLGHSNKPGDFIWGPNKPNITLDEALNMLRVSTELYNDILRLLDKLSGSTGDINALWRVVDRVGLIGRFMGAHPYQNQVKMKRVRDERVPWWHSDALSRAAKMQDYPEKLTAVATRIYNQLKVRTDGPPSWDAVRAVLRRDLAKKRRKSK
jgi:hypothetical protein